jgi:hypothetical protein
MKNLRFAALLCAVILMILGIIARLFMPGKVLFELGALTYLRLTIAMLLFAITFHLVFNENK